MLKKIMAPRYVDVAQKRYDNRLDLLFRDMFDAIEDIQFGTHAIETLCKKVFLDGCDPDEVLETLPPGV